MSQFWRFWSAAAASNVGTGVTNVALPLTALLLLQASPFEVGLVAGSGYVGWAVLGLPAGALCQLLPLRGVQVTADLVRAAATGSVPLAWALGGLGVTQLVVVALVVSFCNVMFDVSNSTFLTSVVDDAELTLRNSWLSGLDATAQVAGPSLAGVLVQAMGAANAMVVDAVSYLVSAFLLRSLPARRQPQLPDRPPLTRMIADGWRHVVREPIMRACLLDATAANFVSGALFVLTPLYLVRELDAPPVVVGLVLAAEGVGGLIGATLTTRLSARWGTARAVIRSSVFAAVAISLLPLVGGHLGVALFAIGSVGTAAGGVVTSINTRTYRQVASPPELLSRVMATVRFVSWGVVPVASFLAGALAQGIGARPTLVVFCLLAWSSPLILVLSPVRGRRDLDPRMRVEAG